MDKYYKIRELQMKYRQATTPEERKRVDKLLAEEQIKLLNLKQFADETNTA